MLRARAINGAGHAAYRLGHFAEARSRFMESLQMRQELGDRQGVCDVLHNLGYVTLEMGDYLKMLPHKHGTDGFFAAVLERKAAPAKAVADESDEDAASE